MATRSNAIAELTRFWLQARHGCLLDESVAVRVPYGTSDIDFVAMRPDGDAWALPNGSQLRRAIVEVKDEHDDDKYGTRFGKALRVDTEMMGLEPWVSGGSKPYFTMLRQEHYAKATQLFGTNDFDRVFVVHAPSITLLSDLVPALITRRIHWLTIHEVVADLTVWYGDGKNRAFLRHTLAGDLWHLLIGFCGLRPSHVPE